jgi:O-antigen ligase
MSRTDSQAERAPWLLLVVLTLAAGVVMAGIVLTAPSRLGLLLLLGGGALIAVWFGLRSPVLATTYFLLATFFRLAVPTGTLPVDPFLIAFGGVVVSVWVWPRARRGPLRAVGVLEGTMALYVLWNVASLLAPHAYPAGAPLDPADFSDLRFVLIGTVMPFTMFLVGRRVFCKQSAIRLLLWLTVTASAYSAAVSIFQFHGPAWLVWPRYILHNDFWPGRAVGVFNQPVVNGLVLIVGFLVAVLIVSHRNEPPSLRVVAAVVAAASAYGVFLTHTRAAWLSFALVVVIGVVFARGARRGFALVAALMLLVVAANWSTFTSADRSAGGVASSSELEDRWNTVATSLWAVEREPVTGWGIGRFTAVNTYHHQQWAPEIPWERGFGIPSHLDVLGIFVELGIVGLTLWLAVLGLIVAGLVRAGRLLPARGQYNKPYAVIVLLCILAQVTTGLTVDLRFFDFSNMIVMLLAGSAIGTANRRTGGGETADESLLSAPPRVTASPAGLRPASS